MRHLFCLCIIAYFISLLLIHSSVTAQRKIIDFTRTSSVDVITHEQVYNIKIANVTDILRLVPQTHHINSREIIYDYNDAALDKNTQKIFYDAQNNPSYIQSVITNINSVPVKAIEEVYIGNDLRQGYMWNSLEGQSAQTYDDASNKYIPYSFQPSWTPMFQYTPVSPSTIQPMNNSSWRLNIQNVFGKGNLTESVTENMYGGRGEVDYSPANNMHISETKLYDSRKVLREYIYKEYYSDDWMYEEVSYYDCNGNMIYFESTLYDDYGYKIEMVNIAYKNGRPVAGWRDVDDEYAQFRQYYNPATGQFEYINLQNWLYAGYTWNKEMALADEPCDDFPYNAIFFGGSLISEDSYPDRFNTAGVQLSYTRYLCSNFGITGDAGITFGSQFNVDYTKINIFGGITYVPFKTMGLNDNFTFSLHALAGITSVTSKSGTFKSSGSNLGGDLGINLDYNFNRNWGLQGNAGWNPVFGKGNTSSNYRLGLGLRYEFSKN